ncbi:hypothetical protein CSKR_104412 [Clonorchis sinensis]|uniref:Uncharacterized protein n=1 Tax=Clonorchis sinensis TaxID=79923 RepID=A0A3R7FB17_CLOSI|nr:hypothetical protein CSKR_104412 [Clonorchis sinensis]
MRMMRSDVTSFRCLTAIPPEGCKRTGILPGCLREVERRRSGSNHEVGSSGLSANLLIGRSVVRTRPHLSRLGQPGSISALVLPSGGMAARHRKSVADERSEAGHLSACVTLNRAQRTAFLSANDDSVRATHKQTTAPLDAGHIF